MIDIMNKEYNIKSKKSEDISIEDIANCLNDLEGINSFFILERGDCSYLQCINYNSSILIEERIYKDDGFKHYVLGHSDCSENIGSNCSKNLDFNSYDTIGFHFTENNENELVIDDKFFKRYSNEVFSIEEAIAIFTDYYTNILFEDIVKRDITFEFGKIKKGFIFIKWLNSAVDSFNETLEEFREVIEPFVVDELKKDCVGSKIEFNLEIDKSLENGDGDSENNNVIDNSKITEKSFKCSAFKVIDINWACESIIEIAKKYEFLNDIVLFKKNNIHDNEFFKLNIEDFM